MQKVILLASKLLRKVRAVIHSKTEPVANVENPKRSKDWGIHGMSL